MHVALECPHCRWAFSVQPDALDAMQDDDAGLGIASRGGRLDLAGSPDAITCPRCMLPVPLTKPETGPMGSDNVTDDDLVH